MKLLYSSLVSKYPCARVLLRRLGSVLDALIPVMVHDDELIFGVRVKIKSVSTRRFIEELCDRSVLSD